MKKTLAVLAGVFFGIGTFAAIALEPRDDRILLAAAATGKDKNKPPAEKPPATKGRTKSP